MFCIEYFVHNSICNFTELFDSLIKKKILLLFCNWTKIDYTLDQITLYG